MAFPFPVRRFKPKVTKEERYLCRHLRKERIPFTAQARVQTQRRRYLVDMLIDGFIVVEVGHVGVIDLQEDEDLRSSGYIVLRFKNKEVMHNVKMVTETIKKVREGK
jgi:very-short-patch-repair endonuclease